MISSELLAPAQRIRPSKRRAAHPDHWLRPAQGDKEKPMTQSRASEPARRILAHAGLRTSLPRLVVLSAFHEQDAYTVEELYQRLREPTNSITQACVQSTLRSLGRSGVLVRDAQRRYRLAPSFSMALDEEGERRRLQ